MGLIIGLSVGGVLLLMAFCGVGGYFLLKSGTGNRLVFRDGTARVSGRLMLIHKDKPALGRPAKRWLVKLEAGKTYQMDMMDKGKGRGRRAVPPGHHGRAAPTANDRGVM